MSPPPNAMKTVIGRLVVGDPAVRQVELEAAEHGVDLAAEELGRRDGAVPAAEDRRLVERRGRPVLDRPVGEGPAPGLLDEPDAERHEDERRQLPDREAEDVELVEEEERPRQGDDPAPEAVPEAPPLERLRQPHRHERDGPEAEEEPRRDEAEVVEREEKAHDDDEDSEDEPDRARRRREFRVVLHGLPPRSPLGASDPKLRARREPGFPDSANRRRASVSRRQRPGRPRRKVFEKPSDGTRIVTSTAPPSVQE